jgi:hypothetical protein
MNEDEMTRGYDTQGLFWADVLLRTRQLEVKRESPRRYADVTALLVEIAKNEGWHSQS